MAMVTVVKTGSVVAAVATVAMMVADNNRNCRGRQQSTKCSSGSGRDSRCGSVDRGSTPVTAGKVGCAVEVTTTRTVSTATTVVVNLSS